MKKKRSLRIDRIKDYVDVLCCLRTNRHVTNMDIQKIVKKDDYFAVYNILEALIEAELVTSRDIPLERAGDPKKEYLLTAKGQEFKLEIYKRLSESLSNANLDR